VTPSVGFAVPRGNFNASANAQATGGRHPSLRQGVHLAGALLLLLPPLPPPPAPLPLYPQLQQQQQQQQLQEQHRPACPEVSYRNGRREKGKNQKAEREFCQENARRLLRIKDVDIFICC
jgi:hypothetical protein